MTTKPNMNNFPSFCLDILDKLYHINNAPDLSVSKSNWKASCQLLGHNCSAMEWDTIRICGEIHILCPTPKMLIHILAVMWYIVANATAKQMLCYILTSAVFVSHKLFCDCLRPMSWNTSLKPFLLPVCSMTTSLLCQTSSATTTLGCYWTATSS